MRRRAGFTLIEVMVVVAVLVIIAAVGVPSLAGLMDIQQRGAAKELAQTVTWLSDEARLQNVSFRLAINLDRNTWQIEVGDPGTLVFGSPEERVKAEEELKDAMFRFTEREVEEGAASEEGAEVEGLGNGFTALEDPSFTTKSELPGDTRFAWVYTAQYGEDGLRPHDAPPEDAAEDRIAYVHVFADGTAEHAVIRLVSGDDPEDGYSVEVDPLTGRAAITTDVVDPSQSFSWIPTEGPTLR